MPLSSRVPLAWHNLTHDRRRLLVSVLGVAFAVFLMFVELGFWNALLDASVELIQQFNGELIVVSKARYALNVKEPFTRRLLERTRSVAGVEAAYPVYLEYSTSFWKDTGAVHEDAVSHPIRAIAFDPDQPVLLNREIDAQRASLKIPFTLLLDRKSKREYGRIHAGVERELTERTVRVAGTFTLGTDFTSDGSAVMSDLTFARLFPNDFAPASPLDLADVGVVKLEPGTDVEATRRAVEFVLPRDVAVYTKDEFVRAEKKYWQNSTPIGFIFRFGLCMGFIVGAVICYQIISTEVGERLPEFATLKAIGYRDGYLNRTVLRQTGWLAAFGFVPGLALSWLLYRVLDAWIGLPMRLTTYRILLIFILTAAMCLLSGLIALRKVKTADPAEVFG